MNSESIDGIDYYLSIVNGEAFIEPGHDRVLQSTRIGGRMLLFSGRSTYEMADWTARRAVAASTSPEQSGGDRRER